MVREWSSSEHRQFLLLSVALALLLTTLGPDDSWPDPCTQSAIGLVPSQATGHSGPVFGEALGQVFLATDTLISSIVVWREAQQDTNYFGIHLYITATDSLGRPIANAILQDGPSLFIPFGDGIHPIEFAFNFDPPLSLPHAGRFCIAFQADPCDATWNILSNKLNAYADGSGWLFGRSDCTLRPSPREVPTVDLVFRVVFCHLSTPVRRSTWGSLKRTYK